MVLENERREIYEDFVNESLRRVNQTLESEQASSMAKRDAVMNTMNMLKHSLIDTEVAGSASIRPHLLIGVPPKIVEDLALQAIIMRDG